MLLPWLLCGVLLAAVIMLSLKTLLLKRSLDEIRAELQEHLSNESNTLLSTSSNDKQVRRFVAELNRQLRLLRRQRQRYLSGGRELKEAVTNISHDLRTPLTAVCGYLELLEGEEKSAVVERYIGIIGNRVEVMRQLTEELFGYSITIASENAPLKQKIILNEMLEESIAGFYAVLKERGIEPIIRMPHKKVTRSLNPSALSRVLANLLSNAIKYSDGDLEITLSETGEITFTNTASDLNQVQVGKLFDRFYTVNTAEKSTGLGLGITRAFVKQMNGTITAGYEHNKLSIGIRFPDAGDVPEEG